VREWLVYAAIMSAVFVVFFRGDNVVGAVAGVLISGPLYLAVGAVLAKLGYQRERLKRPRPDHTEAADTTPTASTRGRPAPTRRTSGGGNRPRGAKR
jgi:hypothetical protein